MDLQNTIYSDLKGHRLEDRVVFPATGYIVQAWGAYTSVMAKEWNETPIEFKGVTLNRATLLNEKQVASLRVSTLPGLGKFEFENEGDIVVTGSISLYNGKVPTIQDVEQAINSEPSRYLPLSTDDIYKEFRLRGYHYTGLFKGIHKIDNEGMSWLVHLAGQWLSRAGHGYWNMLIF